MRLLIRNLPMAEKLDAVSELLIEKRGNHKRRV